MTTKHRTQLTRRPLSSATSIPGGNNEDTTSDQNSTDDDFITLIKPFLQSGCDCHYGKNQSVCTKSFDFDEVVKPRMQCIKLSSVELDLVILGALQSHVNFSNSPKKCHRISYFFRGVEVCKKTSLFVYGIGKSRLESLKAHYKRHGIVPRTHGNTSQLPKNTLNHEVLDRTVTFIKNFAADHAIALPERAPHLNNLKVQLLPSSESKASVWRQCRKVSEEKHLNAVSYSKFVALWNTFTPYIVAMTPASDLCSLCQLNNAKISQNVNVSNHEKWKCLSDQEMHLQEAKSERPFMKRNIAACKEVLQDSVIDHLSPRPKNCWANLN